MLLKNHYYKVLHSETKGLDGVFHIALLPDCAVYRGHFPGDPVCPGVCNIEVIKECASRLVGKRLFLKSIKQCRLVALATPFACPELDVVVNLTPTAQGFMVVAKIADASKTYLEYKGEMAL